MWIRANRKRAPTGESVRLAKSGCASFYLEQETKQGSARFCCTQLPNIPKSVLKTEDN